MRATSKTLGTLAFCLLATAAAHGCAEGSGVLEDEATPGPQSPAAGAGGSGASGAASDAAATTGTGTSGCLSDDDCSYSICDESSGKCVECTETDDTCADGEYCDLVEMECKPGCNSDADCTAPPGECAPTTCDPMTHQCVGCCADADCPIETLCDEPTQACIPGCNDASGCNAGSDCCDDSLCHDVTADAANCGACGTVCSLPNAVEGCATSMCTVVSCDAGFGDCDKQAANGCELDTLSDPANCGGCGQVCAGINGTASCQAGQCILTCNAGFEDCNASAADGCEAEIASDVDNCGACGDKCGDFGGIAACTQGVCSITCTGSWCNCDNDFTNGCEDLCITTSDCGGCGISCDADNAFNSCNGGQCQFSCKFGWDDCDGDPGNGCEADVSDDEQNCGACGDVCPQGDTCNSGNCS